MESVTPVALSAEDIFAVARGQLHLLKLRKTGGPKLRAALLDLATWMIAEIRADSHQDEPPHRRAAKLSEVIQ